MRIVVALGGNALLKRGEPLTVENQQRNVRLAAEALAPLVREHQLIITHGNGPQVGLLALQGAAYHPDESYPLDILDAETEGMIGYLIEQELRNRLPEQTQCATLLTQIEVNADDPAFSRPSKPIGPLYNREQGEKIASERGWQMAPDGDNLRRVVASPRPQRILELDVIKQLVTQGVIVICAGGGGIPVTRQADGQLSGVEAVIDKDHASALLACELKVDVFLMLTDVEAVYRDWGVESAEPIGSITPSQIGTMQFAAGSMAPKVEAACDFVAGGGGIAGIGRLEDAASIIAGSAGTRIVAG